MYSLNRYFDTVNTTTIVMAIMAVSFIGTYFINVLRHKADKSSKFGFVVVLIMLIFFSIVDFKDTIECTKYALDYPNAKALKFEVVEGTYEETTVIEESMLRSFFRQIPSHGHKKCLTLLRLSVIRLRNLTRRAVVLLFYVLNVVKI